MTRRRAGAENGASPAARALESFYALIDELMQLPPPGRGAARRRLLDRFEVERAVLALDMADFSLSVRRSGILPHLCRIRRVQRLAAPLVAAAGGDMVKCEADNVLAVFPQPRDAVAAAVGIREAIAAAPADAEDDSPPRAGIGIDFGRFLLIPGRDAFGDAVNVAHKLGEDLARAGEILVTAEAARRLGAEPGVRLEPLSFSISGLELRAFRVT